MIHSFIYKQHRVEVRMQREAGGWRWIHGSLTEPVREVGSSVGLSASVALSAACDAARAWVDRQLAGAIAC